MVVREKKQKTSTGRKIYRVAIVGTLLYCSVGIALYHLQEKLLFHPEPLPQDFKFNFDIPFKEVSIPMNKTDTLHLIRFFPKDTAKGVVLYFHGNSGNVNRYSRYASDFTSQGYEVWMPDYPGFGKTTGLLTEENIYKQAKEVYKLAHSLYPQERIMVYGKSLGTGVASYLAAKEPCSRLILETPYYSIPDLFSRYAPIYPTSRMSHFKFPVGKYLQGVKAPVTIFHGTDDKLIPYREAAALKRVLKPGDEFITIENGTHYNLAQSPLYREKLDSVLNGESR